MLAFLTTSAGEGRKSSSCHLLASNLREPAIATGVHGKIVALVSSTVFYDPHGLHTQLQFVARIKNEIRLSTPHDLCSLWEGQKMLRPWNGGAAPVGRRIAVVGTSASGKTTMARRLARALHIPHVEMDALHWEANWVEAPDDVLRERTLTALQGDAWSVDGNYSAVRDIIWSRADTVVWLDYPLHVILWRLTIRTFRRVFRRVELWNGNHESLRTAFLSKDSLYVWVLTTYKKRRREYPELLSRPEHAHIRVVRLTSPGTADAWLDRVKRDA